MLVSSLVISRALVGWVSGIVWILRRIVLVLRGIIAGIVLHWIGIDGVHWIVDRIEHWVAVLPLVIRHVSVLVVVVVVWTELGALVLVAILIEVLASVLIEAPVMMLIVPHGVIISASHRVHSALIHWIISSHIVIILPLIELIIWPVIFHVIRGLLVKTLLSKSFI